MLEYVLVFVVVLLGALAFYLGYERLLGRPRKTSGQVYIESLQDLLNGREEAAFAKLRQVVSEDSDNVDAYLRLGSILREHGQPQRALQVHKNLTLRSSLPVIDKVEVLKQLTLDFMATGDRNMALSAVQELVSLDGKNHWGYTQLTKLHEHAGNWDEAYKAAEKTLQLEANKSKRPLAVYKFQAGQSLYKRREYHKARIAFKEAIGLDPQYVEAYLAIGDSYYDEERYEDAVSFWNKLISAVPEEGHKVIDRLQGTLFELGRFGDIQGICELILDHAPKNAKARQALAEFYEKKGDVDMAISLMEQVVEDFPESNRAVLYLIGLYLDRQRSDKIQGLIRTIEKRTGSRRKSNSKVSDETSVSGG